MVNVSADFGKLLTYPKGVHSYRYFLPSDSLVICSCIWLASSKSVLIAEYALAGGKEFGTNIGWRKYLYECPPFGYVNLLDGTRGFLTDNFWVKVETVIYKLIGGRCFFAAMTLLYKSAQIIQMIAFTQIVWWCESQIMWYWAKFHLGRTLHSFGYFPFE